MQIKSLKGLPDGTVIDADVVIIGGGPAGITLARELFNQKLQVVLLESGGLTETAENEALNQVESTAEPNTPEQIAKRVGFHGEEAHFWTQDVQPYGVRCRVLGGSTAAWFGKSAPFDKVDFATRPWIANSGWPISLEMLEPFVERAGVHLNLGPVINDERLFGKLGINPDKALSRMSGLRSFFWQFARSRIDAIDIMRFGPEFVRDRADNVRVFTEATVTELHLDSGGTRFDHAEVVSSDGAITIKVRAPKVAVCASAIENARLLLASRSHYPHGLGNMHDNVGRYLMDHPGARVAIYDKKTVGKAYKPFQFLSLTHQHQTHMYMHGMALTEERQTADRTLNCAFYMIEDRAPNDLWDAMKRLIRRQSTSPISDLMAILTSPGLLVTGLGRKLMQSPKVPNVIKKWLANLVILFNPNFAVREFQSGGLPHKLNGAFVDVITEQPPLRDNRITLSDKTDRLGRPLPRITWQVGHEAKAAIAHMARIVRDEFVKCGLPEPRLEDWVEKNALDDAVIIDMAHTAGTTRMSHSPQNGVVDENCQVHGIKGLYVMGASVFPTSGHANPTLMIAALAVRLADHLKAGS